MPTLEQDDIVFRFPEVQEEVRFSIDFQRTLRIPDSEKTYSLPPGLGRFPVRHVQDHEDSLPEHTTSRGGVILPMWQSEAMWLNFLNLGLSRDLDFPVAIKIAAGKINAVTGGTWSADLNRDPQDYVVSPNQPWLDGFAVERGVIRQFVAMPLGDGYSVEEQLTGEPEWGGLQISVMPLKKHIWLAMREKWEKQQRGQMFSRYENNSELMPEEASAMLCESMGLGGGGRMHQSIEEDPFNLDDWDQDLAQRLFITLVHAKDWKSVTGEPAPNHPPTAMQYTEAGLPWFDYYGSDHSALLGSKILGEVKSVGALHKAFTGADQPDSQDINTGKPVEIHSVEKKQKHIQSGNW